MDSQIDTVSRMDMDVLVVGLIDAAIAYREVVAIVGDEDDVAAADDVVVDGAAGVGGWMVGSSLA